MATITDDDPLNSSMLTFSLQALLHRHESYIAQAEEDRCRAVASIAALERERSEVQAENARVVRENRGLVEQLDALNSALADSDARVHSLTTALENTERELRSVTVAAARADDLEAQLSSLESEQEKIQESLVAKREDEKVAVQRWKKAESTLRDLHAQVDQLEKEAREEKDRHADLTQRMERRRTVERELDGAAGRLKGAAAAHELGRQPHGTNVVSRFVRDILQDNANLQIGIMELRDLLENSNQEVQGLRDQILPDGAAAAAAAAATNEEGQEKPNQQRLSQELEGNDPRRVSPEYHIHHHYHPPTIHPKKDKPRFGRRLTKKRHSLGSPAMMHSAANSHLGRQPSVSSTSTILSQTSVSIPPSSASATSRPWSTRSPATESLASSPSQSGYRPASIFDRVERGFESSQPTSPESTTLPSPMFGGRHGKSLDPPFQDGLDRAIDDELAGLEALSNDRTSTVPAIPEEREDMLSSHRPETPDVFTSPLRNRRRRASHDSLFSVAGMDIHTPTRRYSRMHDLQSGYYPMRSIPRRNFSSAGESYSTPPVISTSNVTADREAPSKTSQHSPRRLLASVCRSASHDVETAPDAPASTPSRKPSLSRRVGGWVRGRWGTGATPGHGQEERPSSSSSNHYNPTGVPPPAPAPTPAPTPATERPSSASGLKNKVKADCASTLRFRYPGVNQKGPVMGFRPPPQAPVSVQPERVDEGLLRESLAE